VPVDRWAGVDSAWKQKKPEARKTLSAKLHHSLRAFLKSAISVETRTKNHEARKMYEFSTFSLAFLALFAVKTKK